MFGSHPPAPLRVRPTRLGIASLACCALGTWLRIDYALVHHHLRHGASGDALQYLERAQELLQHGAVPSVRAAFWPPGTSALWAALSAMDPSQQLSAAWNAGASLLVMPLTAAIAGLLAGKRAAWIALAIAALHPGFIHYSGFALAEQPFQLAIAVAVYLTLSALVRLEAEPVVRAVARAVASPAPAFNDAAASQAPAPSMRAGALHSAGDASGGPGAAVAETEAARGSNEERYITAQVVTKSESQRAAAGGKLAPPTPGGGSAQGKWFGRFRAPPSEPPPAPAFSAPRRGFVGRDHSGPVAAGANRSAFADRGRPGVLGRAAGSARPVGSDAGSVRGGETAPKRGGVLPFRAGANRDAAGASAGAEVRPRAPWTSGRDPSRPVSELREDDAPAAARGASALKAELAAQGAAEAGVGRTEGLSAAEAHGPASRAAHNTDAAGRTAQPANENASRAGAADSGARETTRGNSSETEAAASGASQGAGAGRFASPDAPSGASRPGSTGAARAIDPHGSAQWAKRLGTALDPANAAARASDSEGRSANGSAWHADAAASGALRTTASGSGPTGATRASDFHGSTEQTNRLQTALDPASIAARASDSEGRSANRSASHTGAAGSGVLPTPSTLSRAGAVASGTAHGGDASRDADLTRSASGPSSTHASRARDAEIGTVWIKHSGVALGPASGGAEALNAEARSAQVTAEWRASYAAATRGGWQSARSDGAAQAAAVSGSAASDQTERGASQAAADGNALLSADGDELRGDVARTSSRRTAAHALAGTANLCVAGAAVGCAWGLAALIRADALAVAALGTLAVLIACRNVAPRRAVWAALGATVGAIVVLAAAAHRCSEANGHFCLVSNDFALNAALGQAGPVSGLEFRDPHHPELATTWIAPSLAQHGYQGLGHVPASVYDAPAVWRWIGARLAADPVAYAVRAAGNALDLFNLSTSPDELGRISARTALVLRQVWSAAVFVPALFACFALARRAFGATPIRPVAIFVLGALLGLTLSAALTVGESRYRIPFDGLWIGLASAVYARANGWYALDFVPAEPLATRHWMLWSNALVVCVVAVIALSHPGLNLGLLLPQRGAALPNRGRQDWATAAAVAPGSGSSAYVWRCQPDCGELRVRFGSRRRERRVSLSVDANDRYRLLFYRSGELQAYADVPPAPGAPEGLQTTTIEVPAAARGGFETIGVQPLYGDGHYALGHLRLD